MHQGVPNIATKLVSLWKRIMLPSLLVCIVIVWTSACGSLDVGLGGKCHNSQTGKVIDEVEDLSGELWPVEKFTHTIQFAGQDWEYCAVSIKADMQLNEGDRTYFVLHPETGEVIYGDDFFRAKGMMPLRGYEWY